MAGHFATVPLAFPLEINGKEVAELRLRKPTYRDMLAVGYRPGRASNEATARLIARMAAVPPTAIYELDELDRGHLTDTIVRGLGEIRP